MTCAAALGLRNLEDLNWILYSLSDFTNNPIKVQLLGMLQYIGIGIQCNMTDHEYINTLHIAMYCDMLCIAVPITLLVWGRNSGHHSGVENILADRSTLGELKKK